VAVTVPYIGDGLRMTLLIPDRGGFDAVLEGLDDSLIAAASTPSTRYELTMPPFQVTSQPNVLDAVKTLGVVDLFAGGTADLSGIAGEPGGLFANAFVHQAKITVDENGTEAAAGTGMAIAASAPPQADPVVIDRPHLFWIAETVTGAPLFLGVVTNPAG
jgi:serpin B